MIRKVSKRLTRASKTGRNMSVKRDREQTSALPRIPRDRGETLETPSNSTETYATRSVFMKIANLNLDGALFGLLSDFVLGTLVEMRAFARLTMTWCSNDGERKVELHQSPTGNAQSVHGCATLLSVKVRPRLPPGQ